LQLFIRKYTFFSAVNFFQFMVIKILDPNRIRIRIRFDLKCWTRIRIETNADPKHWKQVKTYSYCTSLVRISSSTKSGRQDGPLFRDPEYTSATHVKQRISPQAAPWYNSESGSGQSRRRHRKHLSRLAFSVLGGGWAAAATTGTGMKTGTAMTGSPRQNQGIFLGCQLISSFLWFTFLFLSKLIRYCMQKKRQCSTF
jgi:hypothetical protein